MRYRLFAVVVFLAIPAVAVAPRTLVSTCDVQMRVRDGRNPEGVLIPGESAELTLPCIRKEELERIIEDFNKGDAEKMDQALAALRGAKQIKVVLTPENATREKD